MSGVGCINIEFYLILAKKLTFAFMRMGIINAFFGLFYLHYTILQNICQVATIHIIL